MADDVLSRLRRLSRPFMILLSIALGLLVLVQSFEIAAILFFFHGGAWHAVVSFSASGINLSVFADSDHVPGVSLESLAFRQRAMLALLGVLCTTCAAFAISHLRELFALYSKGVVFDEMNVRHMKLFGCWLVVASVAVNLSGRAFFAVTGEPAHDTANAAMAVVYGGMIYVIARVMELAREADEERRAFV